jgi:hypothetical protein
MQQNNPIYSEPNPPAQQYNAFLYPTIDSLSGWMKFMGIYTIVLGSIYCLGIITAAFGVPLILGGKSLFKASNNILKLKQFNNPFVLNETFSAINKYFKITGIITIISVVLTVIYAIVLIFAYQFLS